MARLLLAITLSHDHIAQNSEYIQVKITQKSQRWKTHSKQKPQSSK